MRKLRRISILSAAAIMSLGAVAFTACDAEFTPLAEMPAATDAVLSNGGFVVEKGDYVYFINGVDTHTSDNTYGSVVKGALMRTKKSDMSVAETVVPSLMVASDYTAGLFIYGDRVYYATPNNAKNADGQVENEYLAFKSAKLDGSDVQDYITVSDKASNYRFVESGAEGAKSIYLLYKDASDLRSYNTATGTDTLLAQDTQTVVFDSSNKGNPVVYYTMSVTADIDKETSNPQSYKQVYSVSADTTQAPYTYTFDEEYVKTYKEENDDKELYVNLGTLVLDGVGSKAEVTQFTHDLKEENKALLPVGSGFTYELTLYANGGIYFTREGDLGHAGSEGSGPLYFLSQEKAAQGDSITRNYALDMVAQNTTNASSTALFYRNGANHAYLYVKDSVIKRADVTDVTNGNCTEETIARQATGATLSFIDGTDETYKYVYYTVANDAGGVSINRAVYNGNADDYNPLNDKSDYNPVKILNVQHASSWYGFELVDGRLYYADAETFDSTAYNYVSTVKLSNAEGKMLTNSQIESELNDKYEEAVDYIAEVAKSNAKVSTAIKSYYYTENSKYFNDNIQFAIDNGKKETFLYSEADKAAFNAYVNGKEGETDLAFKDYRLRKSFITRLGVMSEADVETYDSYWTNALEHFTVEEEEDEGLPVWAWVLIGVGIGIVVLTAVLVPIFVVRAKNRKKAQEEAPKKKRMHVDTTDDKSVDVYADETVEPTEELQEEAPVVEAEEAAEEATEAESAEETEQE